MANATATTSPSGFTSGAPESPGPSRQPRSTPSLRASLVVDVGAGGVDFLAQLIGRDPQRATTGIAVHPAPVARITVDDLQPWPVEPRDPKHGQVSVGVEGHRFGVDPAAIGTDHRGLDSPAMTCALVTTRSVSTTKPLPSWMRLHASPSILTEDASTLSLTAGEIPVDAGGGPSDGRGAQGVEHVREAIVAHYLPQRLEGVRASGRASWMARATALLRASIDIRPERRPCSAGSARPPRSRRSLPRTLAAVVHHLGLSLGQRHAQPPSTSPSAWPTKAPPNRIPTTERKRRSWSAPSNASMTDGTRRAAMYRPSAMPAQDVARATKPRR